MTCQYVAICVPLNQAKRSPETGNTAIRVTTVADNPQTVTILGFHDKL